MCLVPFCSLSIFSIVLVLTPRKHTSSTYDMIIVWRNTSILYDRKKGRAQIVGCIHTLLCLTKSSSGINLTFCKTQQKVKKMVKTQRKEKHDERKKEDMIKIKKAWKHKENNDESLTRVCNIV